MDISYCIYGPANFILDKGNPPPANYDLSLTMISMESRSCAEILFDDANAGHQYVDSTFPYSLTRGPILQGPMTAYVEAIYQRRLEQLQGIWHDTSRERSAD